MGYFRRSREERERVRQVNRDPTVRRANRHMFTMLLAIFVFLFLMLGPLSPPVHRLALAVRRRGGLPGP